MLRSGDQAELQSLMRLADAQLACSWKGDGSPASHIQTGKAARECQKGAWAAIPCKRSHKCPPMCPASTGLSGIRA